MHNSADPCCSRQACWSAIGQICPLIGQIKGSHSDHRTAPLTTTDQMRSFWSGWSVEPWNLLCNRTKQATNKNIFNNVHGTELVAVRTSMWNTPEEPTSPPRQLGSFQLWCVQTLGLKGKCLERESILHMLILTEYFSLYKIYLTLFLYIF